MSASASHGSPHQLQPLHSPRNIHFSNSLFLTLKYTRKASMFRGFVSHSALSGH